jgi:hypothetical protein
VRTTSFGLDERSSGEAYPLRDCVGTTGKMVMVRTTERRVYMLSNGVYLKSLLDLFYKHIAICSKTVHGEYSAVRPRGLASIR